MWALMLCICAPSALALLLQVYISHRLLMPTYVTTINRIIVHITYVYITLRGRITGKVGIHLKCIPEKKDTTKGRVMHIIEG